MITDEWVYPACTWPNGDQPTCVMCDSVRPRPPPPPLREIVQRQYQPWPPRTTWECLECSHLNDKNKHICEGCLRFHRYCNFVLPLPSLRIVQPLNDRGNSRFALAGNDDHPDLPDGVIVQITANGITDVLLHIDPSSPFIDLAKKYRLKTKLHMSTTFDFVLPDHSQVHSEF